MSEARWCVTCSDNIAGRSGECSPCSSYRRKYGRPRPEKVILRHLARRAKGEGMASHGGLAQLGTALRGGER